MSEGITNVQVPKYVFSWNDRKGWIICWHEFLANRKEILTHLGPVYTSPDKFLHRRILFQDRLFTRIRANSVTNCSGVYTDRCKSWTSRGIWMAFWRLCCDWLSLLLCTNHVAALAMRGKSTMAEQRRLLSDWLIFYPGTQTLTERALPKS